VQALAKATCDLLLRPEPHQLIVKVGRTIG
jgi:hypothetical protein